MAFLFPVHMTHVFSTHVSVVIAKLLVWQTAVLMNGSSSSLTRDTWLQVIALLTFYDAITGPTEFIISLVNSVKIDK